MAAVAGKTDYGDVIISLENCILSEDQLDKTPSIKDGLDKEVEIDLRIVGCEYIQMAGILLKLPQVAMATAQVLFQRFYYSKSLVKHDGEIYAMASIFLAAKIEECPRRIRDVINVFHHIKQKRNGSSDGTGVTMATLDQSGASPIGRQSPLTEELESRSLSVDSSDDDGNKDGCENSSTSCSFFGGPRTIQPMEYLGNYFSLKNQVIKAERRILKELGFCVHVKHPHKIIIMYLQILDCETNTLLAQQAWNFMNDSFRTNIFLRYPPETIGCACIFLSARQLGICLPTRPPWWELFGAKLEDLEEISLTLLSLYTRPKANLDTLQKAVGEIRKELEQKKKKENKADGAAPAGNSTPNLSPTGGTTTTRDDSRSGTGSRPSSPSKVSPSSAANPPDGKKKKSSSKADEDKRTSHKERAISRGSRRSQSPVNRRSRSRSGSRTRSGSRSRSRSYSISISPDNPSISGSDSSDESPDKQKMTGKSKRRRSPTRGRDEEKRSRPRKYDGEYVRKKARTDGSVNSYKREKTRERSRSPLSKSRSRSRSKSRSPAKTKQHRRKYEHGRETKKREDRHRDRNGVDYRSSRDKGRDHGRHRR